MSELLQSAMQHPDADQLTAFAEQALPAHEREQTLAHLAVCSACREVVFLAQEAVPMEVVAPVAAPRRSWFAGWNLVWPAVGALAGIVAVTVHLRTVTKAPEQVTTADAVTVTAPAIQLQTESAMATSPAPVRAMKAAPPPKAAIVLEQPKVTIAAAQPAIVAGMAGGSGAGVSGGMVQHSVAEGNAAAGGPMQSQYQYLQQNQAATAATPVPAPKPVAPAMAGLAGRAAAAPMAAPAPPPPPPARTSNATVEVTGADMDALSDDPAALDTELLPLNGRNAANLASITPVLPSHLAAISTVASGTRSVAVDSKGGVFLSTDGGRKWKAVKAAWSGQAIAVRTVASGTVYTDGFTGGALAGKMATMRARQPSSNPDRADLEGSVTDAAGAVVPGATVKVSPVAGGNVTTARSNGSGAFTVLGLAPGEYRVEIAAPGFEQYVERRTLIAGERAAMPVRLQVGSSNETITVQSDSATVEAKKKVAATPVFALKTDAGVVWVSVDGKKWTRQ